jgi:acetyl-CoA C-acetyltransferase
VDAVIVAAARSPIGRANKGSLAAMRADDLAVAMARAASSQVPALDPSGLDDIILGCAQPAGEQGYNLARSVAVRLGLDGVPGTTVNRYCASSLQAVRMAFHAIRAGEGHAFLAAGAESVSRYGNGKADGMPDTKNPAFRPFTPAGRWVDPRESGELPDLHIAMGETAENVAQWCGVSREEQDEFAVLSQNRAEKAIADGFFDVDITPVTRPDGTVVATDDGPRAGTTLAKLATLAPVFRPDGTVTAGNACPLNDGAAAVVVMSSARARDLGLRPLARIVATGVSALSPEIMGLGPIEASRRALAHAGLGVSDVDLVEINEAFAAQVVPVIRELGLDPDRVNVHGGAIALGHPFGMTGARIATTLVNSLRWRDKQFGLETMCTAGGQGMAMVLERLT